MKYFAAILFIVSALPLAAQSVDADDEVSRLRAELDAARRQNAQLAADHALACRQIDSLRQEVAALQGAPATVTTGSATARLNQPWQSEVAAGGNYATGNVNAYRVNLGVKAVRETVSDHLALDLAGEYGRNSGQLDAERLLAVANYRHNLADHWYWLANYSFLHDGVSGLDFRSTLGPGAGYYFIKSDAVTLLFEGGPAYVWERNEGGPSTSSIRGRLAQEFNWQFTPTAKLFERCEFLDNLQSTDNWVGTLEGGIETAITKTISLRLSGRYQYNNEPADDRRRGDFTALGALVYKFGENK
ncbi:MAG: DUF481 domain-containing protein [Verrucomicrobiales bacterium]|jgi:putative salt-induced outer membrane protein YdiY|nr:DUF481 domain-containing protein [Verrucomicrobiales bacterium]